MHVIRILCDALGDTKCSGYLRSYDVSNPDRDGCGVLTVTQDINEAQRFEDFIEATDFWKQQSASVPLRMDGRPNRPLTAFTITVEHVKEPAHAPQKEA